MKDCSKVISISQFSGTCWFNAVMMTMFQSEGMRSLLLSRLPKWDLTNNAKKIIRDILIDHHIYINDKHIDFFNKIKPEVLLKSLYTIDSRIFEFDPDTESGYFGGRYMYKLMHYLDITDFVILDAINSINSINNNYNLFYGQYNAMTVKKKKILYSKSFSRYN